MFEYHIQNSIKDQITEEFATTFWNALRCVFPNTAACLILDYDTGTAGWNDAFKLACEEHAMLELHTYAATLEWYDWDVFSYELTEYCFRKIAILW